MPLDTNFDVAPYFDDFNEEKNFHRVLFRPSLAVQARELTQLQTILQNQIERFGDNIFVEGTIIKGCNFIFDNQYYYAKLADIRLDGNLTNPAQFVGYRAVCNTSNLQAIVVNSTTGLQSQAPDLNTIFIKYINSGNGTPQFQPGDVLSFYSNTNPNDSVSVVNTYSTAIVNNAISGSSNATGSGYSFKVSDGVIFQKGFFINVANSTSVIVSKYSNLPNNAVVGFSVQENIITELQDSSLYDNAAGYTNQNAPGATRLQLIPQLVTSNTSAIPSNNFFTLVEWQNGNIVRSAQQTEYSSLGRELARRTYEESGNYVVNPFTLTTEALVGNTTYLNLVTSSGLAYVDGYRVELQNNLRIPVRQGNDVANSLGQTLSVSYGNYVLVNEFVGNFPSNIGATVSLRDTALGALTNNIYTPSGAGNEIGQAKLLAVELVTGVAGVNTTQYAMYLGDIAMNSGQNFSSVKSIYYNGSTSGTADTVLTGGLANIVESNFSSLVFDTTKPALKTLRANNNNQYVYRTVTTGVSFATNGYMAAITRSGQEQFAYGSGFIDGVTKQNILVIPTSSANVANVGSAGTVSAGNTVGNTQVVGTSTTFQTSYAVGDYININNQKRFITSISNNTLLNVNSPFTGAAPAANTHNKCYPAYVPIPIASRPDIVNITSNTQSMTITLVSANGTQETLSSSLNALVYYDVRVNTAQEIGKAVNTNIVALFDTASNTVGSGTLTCNLTSNTVTGVGTFFSRDIYPGYVLKAANGTTIGTVNSVANSTSLTLTTSNAAIAATSNAYTYTATNPVSTSGPWYLGIPDAYQLVKVYKGNAFANTTSSGVVDATASFNLDSGQRDAVYDISSITQKSSAGNFVKNGDKITVIFNAFTQKAGTGHGYFSIDSYPIDDANTANTSAIQTIQIPKFTCSTGEVYDLRNSIDFRPVVQNTAVYTSNLTIATATNINPSNTQSFSGSELYIATPNQLFRYDSQQYLGRIDKLIINSLGSFLIQEGTASLTPVNTSNGTSTSMGLGTIVVPPYPSLSAAQALTNGRTDQQVIVTTQQNRRYTMVDIGSIDNRVKNLEYYTSLNVLESQTSDLAIKSGANTFINRFKNGIFVDQYNDFSLLNTKDSEFSAAIDPSQSELIPRFEQQSIPLKYYSSGSTGVQNSNGSISLQYSNNLLLTQTSATQTRNASESIWNWQGTAYCFPSYDSYLDIRIQAPPTPIINYVPNVTPISTPTQAPNNAIVPAPAPSPPAIPSNYIQGRLRLDFYSGYESTYPLAAYPTGDAYYNTGSPYFLGSVYDSTVYFAVSDTASYFNSNYNASVSIPHSCVWSGYIVFPTTDTYTITGSRDDGLEVYINGTSMFSGAGWSLANVGTNPNSGTFAATAGVLYPITIYYFNAITAGNMTLSWADASGLYNSAIPLSAYYSDNSTLPQVTQADTSMWMYQSIIQNGWAGTNMAGAGAAYSSFTDPTLALYNFYSIT